MTEVIFTCRVIVRETFSRNEAGADYRKTFVRSKNFLAISASAAMFSRRKTIFTLIIRMLSQPEKSHAPKQSDRALTAKALNAFFSAAYTELGKINLNVDTKECFLRNMVDYFLPVYAHDSMGYALSKPIQDRPYIPETLADLKEAGKRFGQSYVETEMSTEVAQMQVMQLFELAYRAAEKAMGPEPMRSVR